jgi:hypothetical protein
MKLQQTVLIAIFVITSGCLCGNAQAGGKIWPFAWGPSHWEHLDHFQPYIDNPVQTQDLQWDNDPWSPSVWAQQRNDGEKRVVADLFKADIFRDKFVEDGVPAVQVGPTFYMLGGQDKRRVTAMLDDFYGITKNKVFGMFTLYDWNSHQPIGTYTQYGLQMK